MTADSAEVLKNQGNEEFKAGNFSKAVAFYTLAIDAAASMRGEEISMKIAIYFCNRSIAQIKMENVGFAVDDASAAIKLNPQFAKAYYRRGCARIALSKFKEAQRDFEKVVKLNPKDSDAHQKLKECKKEIQYQAFAKAITSERGSQKLVESIDPMTLFSIPDGYDGPRYPADGVITIAWISEIMEFMRKENLLHKQVAYKIVIDACNLLRKEPTLVRIKVEDQEFTVCGDIHGQFYDLLNIFEINGLPSETNPYLFNGDFVDRGSFSVECILILFACKLAFPKHFFLARGNHETKSMNRLYGFEGEINSKYDENLYNLTCEAFCALPLAHVIQDSVFVTHGGLFSSDNVSLADIESIDRDMEPADIGIMTELLWSDPSPLPGRTPSKRGVGLSFGEDVTTQFLNKNNLQLVIRSHEMKEEGYEVEHNGKLVTVFSAPNYCDQMGNKGAFVRLKFDAQTNNVSKKFHSFEAVPHPDKRAMCYANRMLGMFGQ